MNSDVIFSVCVVASEAAGGHNLMAALAASVSSIGGLACIGGQGWYMYN